MLLAILAWQGSDIPATIRSRPDFSGAVGRSITVMAKFEAGSITVGNEILFVVSITGVSNPHDVKRPSLEMWNSTFQIEVGGESREISEVRFTYRLRPRSAGTVTMPRIKFVSFNPAAPDGRQLQTTYADVPSLNVMAKPDPPPALAIPDRLNESRATQSWAMPLWSWLVVIPIALIAIPIANEWLNTLAVRRRQRQIQFARNQLDTCRREADPAAAVISLFESQSIDCDSLRAEAERIRFAPAPADVEAFIAKARGVLA